MNKIKFLSAVLILLVVSACATTSDMQIIQNQINSLETTMYSVSSIAASSKESAVADKASSEQLLQKLHSKNH